VNLAATGGVSPYQWQISTGYLPAGLQLSGNTVGGTPTTPNTWYFTVSVLDGAGHSASTKRSITIARRMTASLVCPASKPCQVEAGCLTVCGKFGTLAGGVAPYAYQLTSGQIPTGMGRSGLSLTGTFPAPGTRTGTKTWLFTYTVTDALGVSTQVPANFYVFAHITFSVSSFSCDGNISINGCSATAGYTGGTPGLATPTLKVSVYPGYPAVPPGSTFTARSGTVYVNVPPPGCNPQAPFLTVVSLVLVDTSICGASTYCASPATKLTISLANSC
jgi:hypothetical protein